MDKKLKELIILTVATYVILNMAHPVTPRFITENNYPPYMFGVFFAAMSFGNFIFSPIWGRLSDRYGRVKFMILGILFYGISQVGFGFSTNPIVIVLWRFIGGSAVVSYLTVVLAYIGDITSVGGRLKAMMYYTAASALGGAGGSLLGGALGNSSYKVTFLAQFVMSLIICILFKVFLKESNEGTSEKVDSEKEVTTFKFNRVIWIFMILVGIFFFVTTSYNSSINYYIEAVINLPPSFIGGFLSVAGLLAFLSNLLVTERIGRLLGEIKALKLIGILMGVFLGASTLFNNTILFFIFILLFVACSAVYQPILQNIISKLSKDNKGVIAGALNSFKAVGMICGSLFSGFIFIYGNKLPFIVGAGITFIGVILLVVGIRGIYHEKDTNSRRR